MICGNPKNGSRPLSLRTAALNAPTVFLTEVHHSYDRLDTVEEVTEPASSEFFFEADEAARIGSSGQPSSDFQQDSLPPDHMSTSNISGLKNT